jgi:hypothetical protein
MVFVCNKFYMSQAAISSENDESLGLGPLPGKGVPLALRLQSKQEPP